LQLSSNRLDSSSAETRHAFDTSIPLRRSRFSFPLFFICRGCCFAKLTLPPEAPAILDKIYSFDIAEPWKPRSAWNKNARSSFGYLLEVEALWWRIWCTSANSNME